LHGKTDFLKPQFSGAADKFEWRTPKNEKGNSFDKKTSYVDLDGAILLLCIVEPLLMDHLVSSSMKS
jgi:hypothetical protein